MSPRSTRLIILVAIVLLALVLRDVAARRLPVDFDEPVYFEGAVAYAAAIRAGDLGLLAADPSPEHPGLVKLLYAAVALRHPPLPAMPPGVATDDEAAFLADPANAARLAQMERMGGGMRRLSALLGVLHVLLLAAVSPPAGALLAVHSYTVKYTAQIYLEAAPMLTATVCVLAYVRAVRESRKGAKGQRRQEEDPLDSSLPSRPLRDPLFFWTISAVALGLTAAGKYVYAVAGLAVVVDYLWEPSMSRKGAKGQRRQEEDPLDSSLPLRPLRDILLWGSLALLVFFAASPAFWPNPLGRLFDSLAFHAAYSQGAHVAGAGYPWYQPFVWLLTPQSVRWHPGIILVGLDPLTAALGVMGLRGMGAQWGGRGRVVVLWWALGLAFALLWRTKWPQYSLIMTAPMALCAAEGARALWRRVPAGVRGLFARYD